MIHMIMELVRNRSFTLTIGDSKRSRLRRLKNGVPQGSVLAPLLFNIYVYDLPSTVSRRYAYADDLALLYSSDDWKDLEGVLSQDMTTISTYLQTWRLQLSHTKTVTSAFHLNNRVAKRELNVYNNGKRLPFCPVPTYLGVKLDRSLTFRHHLEALRKKLITRVALMRRLAGSGWGAGAKTHCVQPPYLWSTPLRSTVHQFGVAVHTLASLIVFSTTHCALSLDACVQLQQTIYPFSQVSSRLSFADLGVNNLWHIVAAWTLAIFSMNYWLGPYTATERD